MLIRKIPQAAAAGDFITSRISTLHSLRLQPRCRTAGVIDAQSVKSTLLSGESKGFDPGKKIKGIKRHIIVDTLWMVLAVVIQSASVQDRGDGGDTRLLDTWNNIIKYLPATVIVGH